MGVTAQKLKEVLNLIKSKEGETILARLLFFENYKRFFSKRIEQNITNFQQGGGSQRKIMFFKNIITIHVYVLIQKIQGSFSHTCSLAKIHRSSVFFSTQEKNASSPLIFQKREINREKIEIDASVLLSLDVKGLNLSFSIIESTRQKFLRENSFDYYCSTRGEENQLLRVRSRSALKKK